MMSRRDALRLVARTGASSIAVAVAGHTVLPFLRTALATTPSIGLLDGAHQRSPAGPRSAVVEPLQTLSPDAALARLLRGNRRYATAHPRHPDQSLERRRSIRTEQHPYACVFGCIDSRVPPELIFDEGLGDLLVVRSAGHVVDEAELGSLEFALEEFHIPLIVVLAHTRCGAIAAATDVVTTGAHSPDRIATITDAIRPAVDSARVALGRSANAQQVSDVAGRLHLERTVFRLRTAPLLAEAVATSRCRVVGARYELDTGRVEVLVP